MAINLSNGVVLPDIPVLSDYPYSIIYKSLNLNNGTVKYVLMPTSSKSMYVPMETSGEVCDSILFTGNAIGYNYDSELNEWVLSLEDTGDNDASGLLIPIRKPPSSSNPVVVVPVWMNYEMMVAAKDNNGNYIETNTVADIIETQVVYNNITLPSAITDISGLYPYTSILTVPRDNGMVGYYLIASTTKGLYIPPELLGETYGAAYLESACKMYACIPSMGLDSWVFNGVEEETGAIPLQGISVLWANYDIMVAKQDASGNYIASNVIYDYIIDMIDYNGILLPELPSSDLEYAIIGDATKFEELNGYVLLLSKTKSFAISYSKIGQGSDELINENECVLYIYMIGSASWMAMESMPDGLELPLNDPEYPLSIHWSNYNIMEVLPFEEPVGNIELGIYFPPTSLTEKPLPDIEHMSDYYAVSADFMSSIAKETRRLSGNFARMTPDNIINTLTNTGSYRKLFNKTIENIDFELPVILYPYTFYGCSQLKTVSSEKPIVLSMGCFGACSSLESVSLPNVIMIEGQVFIDCSSLTSVELPSMVESGDGSFYNCNSLTSIDLPNLTIVGYNNFYDCIALTDINIPNVTIIGNYGFEYCENLPTINLPKAQILGYGSFADCAALTTINIPQVIEIQNYTFSDCASLNKIDLPSCISLGSTDYTNSNGVFSNCTNLNTLILRSPKKCTMMGGNTFYNTPIANGTGYIYVPSALLNSYKTDTSWSTYSNQFRAIESYPGICGTDPLPTMWTSGSKDVTNQLQQGSISPYSPYINSNSNTRVSYVGTDLVVNGGDTISVEVPNGYKFSIHTIGDYGYTQTIRKNYVNTLDSGWLSKGSTYTIPEFVNNRPSHIIWVTIAKTTDTEAINIRDLGTVTVTKINN